MSACIKLRQQISKNVSVLVRLKLKLEMVVHGILMSMFSRQLIGQQAHVITAQSTAGLL